MKLVGDNQPYNLLSGEGTESYATVVLKNTNWPGSVTVAHFGSYANVYIGFGMKAGGNAFMPIQPPDVMDDPEEPREQPEVRLLLKIAISARRPSGEARNRHRRAPRKRRRRRLIV